MLCLIITLQIKSKGKVAPLCLTSRALRLEGVWRCGHVDPLFFFASALVGGEWSSSQPDLFTPGERAPGTNWIGCVGPQPVWTLTGFELRPLCRPTRRQSLYRLRFKANLRINGNFEQFLLYIYSFIYLFIDGRHQ
jgi:hypothetical protein